MKPLTNAFFVALAGCALYACTNEEVGPQEDLGNGSQALTPACTAGSPCSFVTPVPQATRPQNVIISAQNGLALDSGSTVKSANGSPSIIANLGGIATTLGNMVKVGGIVSVPGINLGTGDTINGNIVTGGIVTNPLGSSTITGTTSSLQTIGTSAPVEGTVTFPATSPAGVTVSSGTRTLAPGSYGAVNVTGGTLALTAGTYLFTSLSVSAGATLDLTETGGRIVVNVFNGFQFAGNEVQHGGDGQVLISDFNGTIDSITSPFRGTVSVQTGSIQLISTAPVTYAGSFFGASVHVGANNTVLGLSLALPPPPSSPAIPPPPLPPPPTEIGCFAYVLNAWQAVTCATDAFINTFPHPDMQLEIDGSSASQPLVFGEVGATLPQVGSEQDVILPTGPSLNPSCPASGTSVANQFSVQANTNTYTVPAGTIVGGKNVGGHAGWTQFTIQSYNGQNLVCIWNIDTQGGVPDSMGRYPGDFSQRKCYSPVGLQRAGGFEAFDQGSVAGYVNGNGTISIVAALSWVAPGQPTTYATTFKDTYGLSGQWNSVGGGLIGLGNCSQAQFTSAEVVTQVAASTCANDTLATSTVCAPPTFQPNASVYFSGDGTAESNNLTNTGAESLGWVNADLAVSNATATTSGSCLGPSHAYVQDNATDFGATPSNQGGQVFWESPDIFLVPHGTVVNLTSVSTETLLVPNQQFDVYVRVHNDLGCSAVTGAKTQVFLADPSALSTQWAPITSGQYVGNNGSSTGVTVPAGGEALIGPLTFTGPATGSHKCILADIEADGESAPANTSNTTGSNQVAQRNIQFGGACQYPLTNGSTSNGNLSLTLTVTPALGDGPVLTGTPDVEVAFDDSDSSWYNVWSTQLGVGAFFTVTHNSGTGKTTVRMGSPGLTLNTVPLAAGASRNVTGTASLTPGASAATVQIGATLKDSSGNTLAQNGGSCNFTAPPLM
jgi:hypothetical protein